MIVMVNDGVEMITMVNDVEMIVMATGKMPF